MHDEPLPNGKVGFWPLQPGLLRPVRSLGTTSGFSIWGGRTFLATPLLWACRYSGWASVPSVTVRVGSVNWTRRLITSILGEERKKMRNQKCNGSSRQIHFAHVPILAPQHKPQQRPQPVTRCVEAEIGQLYDRISSFHQSKPFTRKIIVSG